MNHRELTLLTKNKEDTIKWLQQKDFLPREMNCFSCNVIMNIIITENKCKFRCFKCRNEKSLLLNTIYYKSNLKIYYAVDLIYWWAFDMNVKNAKNEINTTCSNTVCKWYSKLRLLSFCVMKNETRKKIGGRGKIVQIDESLFSKRKYNVGREVRKIWIVGGIQYDTNEVFFVETFYRSSTHLNQIILENVELGTIIYTDKWKGYNDLNDLGYFHYTVNHKTNFVDPTSGVNTQKIEGYWSVVKRWLKKKNITNKSDLFFYFSEFCFKRKYNDNIFETIMKHARNFKFLTD